MVNRMSLVHNAYNAGACIIYVPGSADAIALPHFAQGQLLAAY